MQTFEWGRGLGGVTMPSKCHMAMTCDMHANNAAGDLQLKFGIKQCLQGMATLLGGRSRKMVSCQQPFQPDEILLLRLRVPQANEPISHLKKDSNI